jgi:hypothetical protein
MVLNGIEPEIPEVDVVRAIAVARVMWAVGVGLVVLEMAGTTRTMDGDRWATSIKRECGRAIGVVVDAVDGTGAGDGKESETPPPRFKSSNDLCSDLPSLPTPTAAYGDARLATGRASIFLRNDAPIPIEVEEADGDGDGDEVDEGVVEVVVLEETDGTDDTLG